MICGPIVLHVSRGVSRVACVGQLRRQSIFIQVDQPCKYDFLTYSVALNPVLVLGERGQLEEPLIPRVRF
jgi:hypothetical protein